MLYEPYNRSLIPPTPNISTLSGIDNHAHYIHIVISTLSRVFSSHKYACRNWSSQVRCPEYSLVISTLAETGRHLPKLVKSAPFKSNMII